MGLAALLCLGIYHNRVMQMDKTNRIFYQTVIQSRRDAEIWQDIDSIVKGIKQHKEQQTDPPKKNDWYIKFLYSDKEENKKDIDMLWDNQRKRLGQ